MIYKYIVGLSLVASVVLHAGWQEAQTLLNPSSNNDFGYSISSSGVYALVGAPSDSGGTGEVYSFKKDENGTWQLHEVLSYPWVETDENGAHIVAGDVGESVAVINGVGGTYAVVGAPDSRKYNQVNQSETYVGAIAIYKLIDDIWVQQASFYDVGSDNGLGTSLDIGYNQTEVPHAAGGLNIYYIYPGHNVIVAGNPKDEKVHIYNEYDDDTWKEETTMTSPYKADEDETTSFGESVAISCNFWGAKQPTVNPQTEAPCDIIVGQPDSESNSYSVTNPGGVCSYIYDDTVLTDGSCYGSPTVTKGAVDVRYGTAVDVHGGRVVIGSEHTYSSTDTGSAFIYDIDSDGSFSNQKMLTGSIVDEAEDHFGHSVAIFNSRAAVGAKQLGDVTFTISGRGDIRDHTGGIFVYDRNGSDVWNEVAILKGSDNNESLEDYPLLGTSVEVVSNEVMGGSSHYDKATVYKYEEPVDVTVNPAIIMYLLN